MRPSTQGTNYQIDVVLNECNTFKEGHAGQYAQKNIFTKGRAYIIQGNIFTRGSAGITQGHIFTKRQCRYNIRQHTVW